MANSVTHAALPYPIKNARFSVFVPYLDADGDPTDPTTPDTEISGDAGAFADAAEEVTTITGSNGMGYITLTGAETNYSMVGVAAKVASGPKATLATLYPRQLPIIATGTLSAGSAGGGTLQAAIGYDLAGCFIRTTGGTGGGGTGGANNQARKMVTYTASTGAFTVEPNWETTPSTDTTYDVLLPEGVTLGMLRALNPTTLGRTLDVSAGGEAGLDLSNVGTLTGPYPFLGIIDSGTAQSATATTLVGRAAGVFANDTANGATVLAYGSDQGYWQARVVTDTDLATDTFTVDTWTVTPTGTITYVLLGTPPASASAPPTVLLSVGTGTGQVNLLSGKVPATIAAGDIAASAITASAIAADAITAAKIADGAIDAATFAAGAINAAAIAADAITAAKIATDAITSTKLAADAIGSSQLAASAVTEIQSGLATAAALTTVGNYIDTEVASILAAVDTEIAAILALLDDPRTEPGQGSPPVNPDLATKIDYLYKAWRNKKTQTASQFSLYADDATTVDQKATFGDDTTTATQGEMTTGP